MYAYPLMCSVAVLHGTLLLTGQCLMQARTLDLCLPRRARSQVHLHSLHICDAVRWSAAACKQRNAPSRTLECLQSIVRAFSFP